MPTFHIAAYTAGNPVQDPEAKFPCCCLHGRKSGPGSGGQVFVLLLTRQEILSRIRMPSFRIAASTAGDPVQDP